MRSLAHQPQDNPAIEAAPDTLPAAPRRAFLNLVPTARARVENAAAADPFARKESTIILGKFKTGLNTGLLAARAKAHARQLGVVEDFETKLARIEREITDMASKREGNAAIIEQRYAKWYMKPLFLGKWAEKGYNRVFWGRGQKVWNRLQRTYFKLDLPLERRMEGWLDSRAKNQAKLATMEEEIRTLESAQTQAGSRRQIAKAKKAVQNRKESKRYGNLQEQASLDEAYGAIEQGREVWSTISQDPGMRRSSFFFGGLVGTQYESVLYAVCGYLSRKYASSNEVAGKLDALGRNEVFKRDLRGSVRPTSAYDLIRKLPALLETELAKLPVQTAATLPTTPTPTPSGEAEQQSLAA